MNSMFTIVMVSDMDRSVRFYRDLLGLKMRFDSPFWTEFDMGTTTLALHHAEKPASPPIAGKAEPVAGTVSLGFGVVNVDRAFEELKNKGVRFVMPPTT